MPISPRKIVLELKPYPIPNITRHSYVRLDFNENTKGFPEAYPQGVSPSLINGYPEYEHLISKLCEFYSVPSNMVLLTNGSDEAIMLTSLTFIEPSAGDIAVLSKPCFVVMTDALKFAGATLREVEVNDDMSFNTIGIEQVLDSGARIAMFATPENPTGKILHDDVILSWCRSYPDTLFVIDEAYSEYAGTTILPSIHIVPNLIVLKTFSKAWGMAGLRLGLVFAQSYLIDYLNRVRFPFNVNALAVHTASKLLDRSKEVIEAAAQAMDRKQQLQEILSARGYPLITGASNSFLLGLGVNASAFEQFACNKGVLVRNLSNSVFPDKKPSKVWGYVRIATGTVEENEIFLQVLNDYEQTLGGARQTIQKCYPDLYVGEKR